MAIGSTTGAPRVRAAAGSLGSEPRPPDAQVRRVERYPLIVERSPYGVTRVHARATLGGKAVAVGIDTGGAQSFMRVGNGAEGLWPNAAVLKSGDVSLAMPGRGDVGPGQAPGGLPVPASFGVDFFLAGTTELKLTSEAELVRRPPGVVPREAKTWPTLPYRVVSGNLVVRVMVDGVPRRLMVDTGSPDLLLLHVAPASGDRPIDDIADINGAKVPAFSGQARLTLRGTPPRAVPVLKAQRFLYLEAMFKGMGGKLDGLLGLTSLGPRRVIIDPSAKVLRLGPLEPVSR
jgi:hypothetical protein